mmetsp:Transcript_34121/g.70490  ORF Transcript_34121/g.70490 Transcript_34121/m.70490 type:complete len:269 (-) Transcript_34121:377-1183(-)
MLVARRVGGVADHGHVHDASDHGAAVSVVLDHVHVELALDHQRLQLLARHRRNPLRQQFVALRQVSQLSRKANDVHAFRDVALVTCGQECAQLRVAFCLIPNCLADGRACVLDASKLLLLVLLVFAEEGSGGQVTQLLLQALDLASSLLVFLAFLIAFEELCLLLVDVLGNLRHPFARPLDLGLRNVGHGKAVALDRDALNRCDALDVDCDSGIERRCLLDHHHELHLAIRVLHRFPSQLEPHLVLIDDKLRFELPVVSSAPPHQLTR